MARKLFLSGPSWPEQPESLPGKAEFNGDNKPDYVLYNSLTFRLPVIAFAWQCSHEQIDRDTAKHCASKMPNNLAQLAPCSLLIAFPSQGQEIDCKLQSNSC
jgi:hypothetical protein